VLFDVTAAIEARLARNARVPLDCALGRLLGRRSIGSRRGSRAWLCSTGLRRFVAENGEESLVKGVQGALEQ
jgi:hypothetical protein